jgi:hypothetical protein
MALRRGRRRAGMQLIIAGSSAGNAVARIAAGAAARAIAAGAIALCALAPGTAGAVSCEWAIRFAGDVVDYGRRAVESEEWIIARRFASDARSPAVDAGREAKACGCPEAIPSFEQVVQLARYAGNAGNLTAAQQYGTEIRAHGEKALQILRKCPGT